MLTATSTQQKSFPKPSEAKNDDGLFGRLTAIVLPIQACNIACTYCYVYDRNQSARMSLTVLRETIGRLVKNVRPGGLLKIIWHGGEPSMVETSFFQSAVAMQREYNKGIKIQNSIQTNGIGLDNDLIRFLRRHSFSVGLSLDGPEELNDLCRTTRSGSGTFKQVMMSVQRMREHKLNFGAICVITKQNKDHVSEIYKFFHDEGIPFRINSLICSGAAKDNLSYHRLTANEYADVVMEFFKLWLKDHDAQLRVATIDDVVTSLISGSHTGCHGSPNCQRNFIGIDSTGDVYPCGRFIGQKSFRFGNLTTTPLAKVLQSSTRVTLLKRNADLIDDCCNCKWKAVCNGGCMHNALEERCDVAAKDPLCQSYRLIYTQVAEELQKYVADSGIDVGPSFTRWL